MLNFWVFLIIIVLVVLLAILYRDKLGINFIGASENIELWIQSPWFEEIENGRKNIEGRAGRENKYNYMIGKQIIIKNPKQKYKSLLAEVIDVKHYDSLEEYIDGSGWQNIAPHMNSKEKTLEAYHNIYDRYGNQVFSDKNIIRRGGMNAIYIKLI